MNVTTTQAYYQHEGEVNLPTSADPNGDPVEVFPTIATLNTGATAPTLQDSYYGSWDVVPGLNRTILEMEFEFVGDTNNRSIQVTYPYSSIWCPPPEEVDDTLLEY